MLGGTVFALGGIFVAWWMYVKSPGLNARLAASMQGLYQLSLNKFYFDELYSFLIRASQEWLANLSAFLDRWILDGAAIRGVSTTTWGIGSLLRLFQVGNLQAYSLLFGLGIVVLIYFTLFR